MILEKARRLAGLTEQLSEAIMTAASQGVLIEALIGVT